MRNGFHKYLSLHKISGPPWRRGGHRHRVLVSAPFSSTSVLIQISDMKSYFFRKIVLGAKLFAAKLVENLLQIGDKKQR